MGEQELVMEQRIIPNGLTLELKGDLTKQSGEALLLLRSWEEGVGGDRLVLNFTGVAYINSAGIATLIRLARTGRKAGFHLYAYGLTSHYQKLFRMVGLTELMMIYPDEYSLFQRFEAAEHE
jgi:stage II sporulation protein AA (anti-sigma F factor antagonist)